MQKIINTIALLSGLTSLCVIGGGAYLYINKDAIAERAIAQVGAAATQAIQEALPGLLSSAMPKQPELPKQTGGVMPPVGIK